MAPRGMEAEEPDAKVDFQTLQSYRTEETIETSGSMELSRPPSTTLGRKLRKMLNMDKEAEPLEGEQAKKAGEDIEYNVFDYYRKDSRVGRLAMDPHFEHLTLGVISMNAIWIGIDTDHNDASDITTAKLHFVFAENIFCFYFTFEVIIRFLAFDRKIRCLYDNWFKFDALLVTFMILETWIFPLIFSGAGGGGMGDLSILRLLRLLRLTRMARLMRSVPELLTLIKGMVAATRSVFSTLVLLIVLMYVFGIVFTGIYKDEPDFEDLFGNMGLSMLVLFMNGTLLDNLTNVLSRILVHSQLMVWIFIVYILAASFTVLNMLIGVLCEIVSATAQSEQENLTVKDVKQKLVKVFEEIDLDKSGRISETEFEQMKNSKHCMEALEQLGVESKHLLALSDTIFEADDDEIFDPTATQSMDGAKEMSATIAGKHLQIGGLPGAIGGLPGADGDFVAGRRTVTNTRGTAGRELNFDEFLEFVVHLRPGTTASVLDIADLRKALRRLCRRMEQKFDTMEESLNEITKIAKAQVGGGGAAAPGTLRRQSGPQRELSPKLDPAAPAPTQLPPVPFGAEVSGAPTPFGSRKSQPNQVPPAAASGAQRQPGAGAGPDFGAGGPAGFRGGNQQFGGPRVSLADVATTDILNELRLRP